MEATVITPTNSILYSTRNISMKPANPVDSLVELAMCRLKELHLLEADVNENQLRKSLKKFAGQNSFSTNDVDEFLDEYEDMVFCRMMDEAKNDPDNLELVDESVILDFLRNR